MTLPKPPRTLLRPWLAVGAGMILWACLALWLAGQAQEGARGFAGAHLRPGARGMLVWVFDNPFMTGARQTHVAPVPRLHKTETDAKQRSYPFSWRWLGALEISRPGEYLLEVYAAEAVRLYIDGRPLIQRWVAATPRPLIALVDLKPGTHLLDLQNVQGTKRLDLSLAWTPPGAPNSETIPENALRPLDQSVRPESLYQLYREVQRWRALAWLLPLAWLLACVFVLRTKVRHWGEWSRRHGWFLGILALAALMRLLWADHIHGLSGESAHFMWRAGLILEGAWPFAGMNTRVGPLFDYLLAPLSAVFGPSAWLLRSVGAILNLLALIFCYRVCLREAGRPFALVVSLILALSPALVIFARMAGDNTSMGPLFFFLGLDLISLSRTRPPLAVWGGILWGLATFNHGLFALLPFSLGLSAVIWSRFRLLTEPRLWGFGLGLLLGYLPRLLSLLQGWVTDDISFTDPARLGELGGFLALFARTLEGEVVYKTFSGQYLWHTHWVIAAAFIMGGIVLLWGLLRARDHTSWIEGWLLTALVIQMVLIPLNAPSANPRYFLYPVFFAGLLLARAYARGYDWGGLRTRRWLPGALILFAALNLTSVGVNYFYAHRTTGGLPLTWDTPLLDHTSDAWMDHRALAQELIRRGYPVVATADFWHHTLHLALNLIQEKPLTFTAVPFSSRSDTERAAVFYNSPEGESRLRDFLRGNPGKKFQRVSLGSGLDRKYILLERTSPPVTHPSDLEFRP
jgi:hypothetical protein